MRATFMSSVYGKTIRVNTVHNRSGNRFCLYLDGRPSLAEMRARRR